LAVPINVNVLQPIEGSGNLKYPALHLNGQLLCLFATPWSVNFAGNILEHGLQNGASLVYSISHFAMTYLPIRHDG